jgi:phenylacetate-CoA ligase
VRAVLFDLGISAFVAEARSPTWIQAAARFLEMVTGSVLTGDVLSKVQARRLRRTIRHAYERSPHYREMFRAHGIRPAAIRTPADLRKLPFTSSREVREFQRFLCTPEEKLTAVFTTSGTTGEPKRIYFTYREMRAVSNFDAVALRFKNPGRLIVVIALPLAHGLWIGSAVAQRVIEQAGGLPLAVGAGDPEETIKWMKRFAPNVVISSPSYMTALTRYAARSGYRPRLDRILVSGEPLTPEQKSAFQEYWGAHVLDSYGTTEIGGGQTLSLPNCQALHLNDLHLVTEIINPQTGSPAEEGELVFTTLLREAMPLVRYRSGDFGCWAQCACGLPFRAVRLAGRTDDMFVAGDMNLYGNVIADGIGKVPGATGRVAVALDKVDLTDRLVLRVEGTGLSPDDVRKALFAAYPEMQGNVANGNLLLEIEPGANLGSQIKAFKISDVRCAPHQERA